jgi:hypothetical protein
MQHELEKKEHHQHSGDVGSPLGSGASETLVQSSQHEDSGGLSTFGDSPLTGTFITKEFGVMSWGALHRGPQVIKYSRKR